MAHSVKCPVRRKCSYQQSLAHGSFNRTAAVTSPPATISRGCKPSHSCRSGYEVDHSPNIRACCHSFSTYASRAFLHSASCSIWISPKFFATSSRMSPARWWYSACALASSTKFLRGSGVSSTLRITLVASSTFSTNTSSACSKALLCSSELPPRDLTASSCRRAF